eukprot:TRINITY_DN32734_c0_g1_i1.p1 TRINITY_DN32734_c0_g1~~TRINITY_DN32734_c0_g1_i1.p1  ORF type:complete len:323 (+),score=131.18 TRINITY_DN32734_c0_g1_i1:48-971(+)
MAPAADADKAAEFKAALSAERVDQERLLGLVSSVSSAAEWRRVCAAFGDSGGNLFPALVDELSGKALRRAREMLAAVGVRTEPPSPLRRPPPPPRKEEAPRRRPKAAARAEAARAAAAATTDGVTDGGLSEAPSDARSSNLGPRAKRRRGRETLEYLKQVAFRETSTVHALQRELINVRRAARQDARRANAAAKKARLQLEDAGDLRERGAYLCDGLDRWADSLEPVIGSLSTTSAQWADRIARSGSPSAALPQGVLAELLATNHQILAKLRQIRGISEKSRKTEVDIPPLDSRPPPRRETSEVPEG